MLAFIIKKIIDDKLLRNKSCHLGITDFINYKKVCMFISTYSCDWKCCTESNLPIETCQNCELALSETIDIPYESVFNRYISNPISKSIVIAGLEPMLQKDEVYELIKYFRQHNCNDDIVIYTGYYEEEIKEFINKLKDEFKNIYIKFGRFIPNQQPHYDKVLGVKLASDNQKGVKIC